MFDVGFYMKTYPIQKRVKRGEKLTKKEVRQAFELHRNRQPFVYNIETTNACNMRCKMCPRTTMMTRKVESLEPSTFLSLVEQIQPMDQVLWSAWESFVDLEYGIKADDMSENHFFLHIIPKVIQLHGYGDPLLDKNIPDYVRILSEKEMPSYFSCNPANIDIEETLRTFESGLDYIKYSIESVDDLMHKQIRGKASNFRQSYKKILKLLEIKKENKLKTTIIITMLDLNRENQKEDYDALKKAFDGLDVYVYMKSEDTQWYRKDFHQTCSIHWSEFCRHPWMSMTVKSNGEVAMCMEDFDNEIILGDVKKESIFDIWNGDKYKAFREDHLAWTKGIRCSERCDTKMIGEYCLG